MLITSELEVGREWMEHPLSLNLFRTIPWSWNNTQETNKNAEIMKQPLLLALIFLLLPFATLAQTVITGHVMNKAGEPLIVTVMVQSKGSVTIAGYASTTATGDYSVTYKGTADSITITVSGINIGKFSKTVANCSGKVDFVIDEKPLEIKEVAVVAPKITARGDTINYLVASYIDQNDRVMKR